MICYFTSGVRGEMETGKTIIGEFDDYGVRITGENFAICEK